MEKKRQIATRYINTPFAYTRLQKGLTLLQQQIMLRVSAHLQGYIKSFFESRDLFYSAERPKPIMTREALAALPPLRINLSEIGISSGTYSRIKEALERVLSVTITVDNFDEDGKPCKRVIFLFSNFEIPITDNGTAVKMRVDEASGRLEDVRVDRLRGYVDIHLNKDAVYPMFDMAQGYVTHPENIARLGRVDNMPLMYYLIRHKMQNFKLQKVKITTDEIREYLGMIKRDPIDDVVLKVQYAQYSRLREKVIKPALNDIKRAYEVEQIDFYFDFKEVRQQGRVRGEPSYLEFYRVGIDKQGMERKRQNSQKRLVKTLLEKYPTLDDQKIEQFAEQVSDDLWPDFKKYAYDGIDKAVEQPHRWSGTHEEFIYSLIAKWVNTHKVPLANKQGQAQVDLFNQPPLDGEVAQVPAIEDYPGRYADEWQELLQRYSGTLKPLLMKARHYGANVAGFMSIRFADKATLDEFNNACQNPKNKNDYEEMMRILAELIGKPAARVLVRGVDGK